MAGHILKDINRNAITSRPEVMMGKPCIAGTRITIETILRRFAEQYSIAEVLEDYPILTGEHVRAALAYAAERVAKPEHA